MPCFKGLSVCIHAGGSPLPEYSVQRQSRLARIACFIPVPPPKIPDPTSKSQEQSTFAVSITLLVPGQDVPYSAPKPTPEIPYPRGKVVGGSISPYRPVTTSPNETVAAYIYFDGRKKEEVATLLRRGEETWVNSRWVSLPESQGGGLAEREFLFREVGLERWLNGLDLDGKDAVKRIEKRRMKMEKHRRKKEEDQQRAANGNANKNNGVDDSDEDKRTEADNQIEDDAMASDSDGDDPIPESAGQIKVALFRVLASGEVKRGEYAPQFNANDDEEDAAARASADVDHTTTFAKPRSLDPNSISTQTVTAIDPPDRPYAVFTFMYRGERQLQKMGIIPSPETKDITAPKKSHQPDFTKLGPLKPTGTVGFVNFRDGNEQKSHKKKKKDAIAFTGGDEDDDQSSDDDMEVTLKEDEDDDKDVPVELSPEEMRQQRELAEGLKHLGLKRPHSADNLKDDDTESEKNNNNTTLAGTVQPISADDQEPPTKRSTSPSKINSSLDAAAVLLQNDIQAAAPPSSIPHSVPGVSASSTAAAAPSSSLSTDPEMAASPMKKQRSEQGSEPTATSSSAQDLLRKHMVAGLESKKDSLAQLQQQDREGRPSPDRAIIPPTANSFSAPANVAGLPEGSATFSGGVVGTPSAAGEQSAEEVRMDDADQ